MPELRLPTAPFRYWRAAGADAAEWLHGQLTQDVLGLPLGSTRLAALLTPTGQLAADGLVHRESEDRFLIGFDRFAAEDAIDTLQSRIVMEDVALTPLPEAASMQGEHMAGIPTAHVVGGSTDFLSDAPSAEAMSPEEYENLRIRQGTPIRGKDYDAKTLVMEMGANYLATRIAFDKGCYTGQEVVERIRSRGRTHRTFVGIQGKMLSLPETVRVTSRSGEIALAFVPWEVSTPGTVVGDCVVKPLPFA